LFISKAADSAKQTILMMRLASYSMETAYATTHSGSG